MPPINPALELEVSSWIWMMVVVPDPVCWFVLPVPVALAPLLAAASPLLVAVSELSVELVLSVEESLLLMGYKLENETSTGSKSVSSQ